MSGGAVVKSLGPANDDHDAAVIEIRLAELLAEDAVMFEPGAERDEVDEAIIAAAVHRLAELERSRARPRSPIEQMIDSACGLDRDGAS